MPKSPSLDLNLLTVFEAIYQGGSISSAAARMSLSQSAISHALSRLRHACGEPLFIRTGTGLIPTAAAHMLFPTVQQSLAALSLGLAEVRGFDPVHSSRRFRVGDAHPLGPFHALALLARIEAEAPHVVLNFDTRTRPEGVGDALRDGVIDVAMDWIVARHGQTVVKQIFEDRLMIVVRQGHPEIGSGSTLEDIRRARFIGLHRRVPERDRPAAVRHLESLGLHDVVRVSEFLEVPTVVAATDYLGVMPASTLRFVSEALGLQFLDLLGDLAVPIYLMWHESRRNDAGHRWLRQHVAACIAESIGSGRAAVGRTKRNRH